jgi:hypothetical protein
MPYLAFEKKLQSEPKSVLRIEIGENAPDKNCKFFYMVLVAGVHDSKAQATYIS